MYPCKICNSNDWKYEFKKDKEFPNGEITAICKKCNYYVKFPATKDRKKGKEEMIEGQQCKKCDGKIIKKESKFKEKKLEKGYYFTHYYYCPKCKTMYLSEKFKIFNKPQSEKPPFAEYKIENGKRYLRNNDWNEFREVGLQTGFHKGKKYIQVVPMEKANFK